MKGETSKLSLYSGDSLYVEGEVRLVNAVEFGADAKGSRSKSCGETVSMFVVELDDERLMVGSWMFGTAGEEYADWNPPLYVEAPPSNAVNSSKRSMSAAKCESPFGSCEWTARIPCIAMFGVCGMLPVDCENNGT